MRRPPILAATAMAVIGMLCTASGWAQSQPTPDQIVRSLTPTTASGVTRGIRIGPNAAPTPSQPAVQPQARPSASLIVQFASGSAELTPEAIRSLNELGRALSDQSLAAYRFRIEGHTDTVGAAAANQALSDRRAAAVVDYIVTNFHIDRGRLEPIGLGQDGLLIPTPDQTAEPRNRRVQVVNIGN